MNRIKDDPRSPAAEEGSPYADYLKQSSAHRSSRNQSSVPSDLITFATCVWNTEPSHLQTLAKSLLAQTAVQRFSWFILDNGSTRDDTVEVLNELALLDFVTLHRSSDNIGIIKGMRLCLERSPGRYFSPLDHDDYLYPDCVELLFWHIEVNLYPEFVYTDEDHLSGDILFMPFHKPDWDPVLHGCQCYTAHLNVFDRATALALGAYGDSDVEESPDWDTVARFWLAGYAPSHLPYILYSWRIHPNSTSGGNFHCKPMVLASQFAVVRKILSGSSKAMLFDVQHSPLFGETPDWWMRRRRVLARPITTLLVRAPTDLGNKCNMMIPPGLDHEVSEIALTDGMDALQAAVTQIASRRRLVHVLASESHPDNDEWAWEATGQFDLYPDTVAVGGRIHSFSTILEAGSVLGLGKGCACPDRGRSLADPGHSAQMWKPHSVDAVSALHAVFDPVFLLHTIVWAAPLGASLAHLGAWVGGTAKRSQLRVVYTPFVSARTEIDWSLHVTDKEHESFRSAFCDLIRL